MMVLQRPLKTNRAISDGSRHFDPCSRDEVDILPPTSPNFHSTPIKGPMILDGFNVHRLCLYGGSLEALGSNSWHASHESVTLNH
ncbi:hypothetical protein TNCV_2891551 [Trichonephila clavipes]|nr:hypothetical protein TNCV_2891551 [Trichonephila clavipes]